MKVGVNLHNFGAAAEPPALLRWATTAEQLGYHGLFISDHVAVTPSVAKAYPEPFLDPFATLAWLAGQTTAVDLGTSVVVLPHRHPALVARLVANIDHLSGGRFILGAGAGWSVDEFAALGLDLQERGRVSDESLVAILSLWMSEVPVAFRGRAFSFTDVSPIACLQRPHVPLWIGGSSEEALRRTVRFQAAWHPIIESLEVFESGVARLRSIAESSEAPTPVLCPRIAIDLRDDTVDGARPLGVGNTRQLHEDLGNLQRAGARYVVLDPSPPFRGTSGDALASELAAHHARGWEMLTALADRVLDLPGQTVR